MSDIIEKFIDCVEEYGVTVRDTGSAILLNQCPSCGINGKFKVSFTHSSVETHGRLLGQCFAASCGEGYTSYKYLAILGVPTEENQTLHGYSPDHAIKQLNPDIPDNLFPANFAIAKDQGSTKPKEDLVEYVAGLSEINDLPNHDASLYAISRGVKPAHHNLVKIDTRSNAVTFLVKENGVVTNYQKRYLNPPFKHMKTKNATGHDIHNSILVFDKAYSDVVVVEGTFTAIAAHNFGFTAVCTFGAGVKYAQLDKVLPVLAAKGLKKVFLGFDLDAAGQKGQDRAARYFALKGIEVGLVLPEAGNDLNDSWQEGKRFKKESLVLNPYIPSINI